MEEKFVFKNKQFRSLCVASMVVAFVIAAVYVALSIVNYDYCANYPRLFCRLGLTILFAVAAALFAHRSSVYMEIGGDFALARRSGSIMIIMLIISALVEAYYSSAVATPEGSNIRVAYMLAVIFVGCVSMLPLIQFQYLNLDFLIMRVLALLGIAASLVSFAVSFFFIGIKEIELYQAEGVLQTVSRVLDGLSPIYLINCFNGIIILAMAHINLRKEMKRNAKFLPENLQKDALAVPKDEDEDDEDDNSDLEYNRL